MSATLLISIERCNRRSCLFIFCNALYDSRKVHIFKKCMQALGNINERMVFVLSPELTTGTDLVRIRRDIYFKLEGFTFTCKSFVHLDLQIPSSFTN